MTELKPLTKGQKISAALMGKKNALRHGHTLNHSYSPTYVSWQAMLSRCRYPHRDNEHKYVQRGINMSDAWMSFEKFVADMGERPEGTTLDRIDNNQGYFKENCRWATPTEQARNRRNTRLTFDQAVNVATQMLQGATAKSVATQYHCSESLPREILKGRSWKDALQEARRQLCQI